METEDVNSSLILQVCLWFENLFYMIIASCHCQLFIWLYTVNRSAFILHWGCNNNSYYLVICWFHSSAQPTVRELFIPIKLGVFSFKHNTLKQTPKQLKGDELQGYKVSTWQWGCEVHCIMCCSFTIHHLNIMYCVNANDLLPTGNESNAYIRLYTWLFVIYHIYQMLQYWRVVNPNTNVLIKAQTQTISQKSVQR